MLTTVIGTSTPLAYWGFSIVRAAARVLFGDCHHIHCLRVQDFAEGLSARNGRHVVFTSDAPDPQISTHIAALNLPVIAFLDRAEDAVAFAMDTRHMDARDGTAFSSMCFCALAPLLATANRLVFDAAVYDASLAEVVGRIVTFLGGKADPEAEARILQLIADDDISDAALPIADQVVRFGDIRHAIAKLGPKDGTLVEAVCAQYAPLLQGRPIERVEVGPASFRWTDLGNDEPGYVRLVGPGRLLYWGPYLYLMPGRWKAVVHFEVRGNLSGNLLQMDVVSGPHVLAFQRADLPVHGVFTATLPFEVGALDAGLEVRCHVYHGSIEGEYLLRALVFERRAEDAATPDPATLPPAGAPAPRIARAR